MPNLPGWLETAVLALAAFTRCCHTTGTLEKACEKIEKLQEADKTRGLHDFDICQLRADIPGVPGSEKADRYCTAHLAMVEGYGQVIVPATCFLPDANDQSSRFLQKQSKGWAFNGKVFLTCGPQTYSVELTSTFEDPKVLLHPDFVPEKRFAQAHNFAVLRISADDYTKAAEASAGWEFARLSESAAKTPSSDAKCRCFGGASGAPGSAEPQEYRVERCQFPGDTPAEIKQQTCFLLKQSGTETRAFEEIASMTECGRKYCGVKQTMTCFCGSTVEELKALNSVGSYFWKKEAGGVRFYSTPLKENWEFLLSSVQEGQRLGATDAQLGEIRKSLAEAIDKCFAKVKGDKVKHIIEKHLCRTELVPVADGAKTDSKIPESGQKRTEFDQQLKELGDCMQNEKKAKQPQPDGKQRALLIPPFEQFISIGFMLADAKVCAKRKAIDAAKAQTIRGRLKRKMRCASLVFRQKIDSVRTSDGRQVFSEILDDPFPSITATVASGLLPVGIGGAIGFGCYLVDPKCHHPAFCWPCKALSTIFMAPAHLLDVLGATATLGVDAIATKVKGKATASSATTKPAKTAP